uniref:Col_cuticle_N domain-containing protein n=1 Tax=Bursaphelenchus xylophilus TaxID=6326 RepID=A0A1I7SX52_BURXY
MGSWIVHLLYATSSITAIALVSLVCLTPMLLKDVDVMRHEWEKDFLEVQKMSNELWDDLVKIGAKVRTPRDRLRRQYETFASGYQGANYNGQSGSYGNQNNGYNNDGYEEQQSGYEAPVAPVYGYGLARLKCCCAMKNIDYDGEHHNLPVSYKCPIGKKGPPGPTGEPGEPGRDGQPGFEGEDYPSLPVSTGFNADNSAAIFDEGYGLATAGTTPKQRQCEPCPRGPPGQPGPKGTPGPSGPKGDHGIQGVHGIPGVSGNAGAPGNVGPRGKSGRTGLPGPRGADGQAGGKGLPGKPGQSGSIGVPGPRGVSGQTGSVGRDGKRGIVGKVGPKGQRGLDGVDGAQGPVGPPGIDAGYCKCPDRVRDVSVASGNAYEEPSYAPVASYPSSNTYSSANQAKSHYSYPSSSSYPAKQVSAPAVAPTNDNEVNGYDPRTSAKPNNNVYTSEVRVNDLQPSSVTNNYQYQQGAYQGQQSPTPRSSVNYNYSNPPKAVAPNPIQPAAAYSPQAAEEDNDYPFLSNEWNEQRKRRLLQRQRQRYVGRSH